MRRVHRYSDFKRDSDHFLVSGTGLLSDSGSGPASDTGLAGVAAGYPSISDLRVTRPGRARLKHWHGKAAALRVLSPVTRARAPTSQSLAASRAAGHRLRRPGGRTGAAPAGGGGGGRGGDGLRRRGRGQQPVRLVGGRG